MGCCGSGARASNGRGRASMANRHSKDLPGEKGMVILEYTGSNSGDETWVGPATRTTYFLGGVRRRGYVDKRDKVGMLAIRDRKRPVFAEVEPIEQPEAELVAVGAMPDWEKEKSDPLAILPSKFADLSVAKIKKGLPSLLPEELETILSAEKSGKNRSTAISAIEAALNERLA